MSVPAVSTEVYTGHLVYVALQQLLGGGLARSTKYRNYDQTNTSETILGAGASEANVISHSFLLLLDLVDDVGELLSKVRGLLVHRRHGDSLDKAGQRPG